MSRTWLAPLLLTLVPLRAAAAPPSERTFALVIGYNGRPPAATDDAIQSLRYADDDALAFYQLQKELGAEAELLTISDAETRRRYPQIADAARPPTMAEISRAIDALNARMDAAVRQGIKVAFIISKPMALWAEDSWLMVTTVAEDNDGWLIGGTGAGFDGSAWQRLPIDLMDGDPNPGVAVQFFAGELGFHGRNARRAHVQSSGTSALPPFGGVLTATPGVVSPRQGEYRIDVAAVIEDHGHPGVWWRFWGGYTPPCNYNVPGMCAQCGCNLPNTPSCSL
jgi:hypothetical protein